MMRARIAIVEDDEEIRVLLADFLRREDFDVETVDRGEALDQLLANDPRPDLIILDWMLPGQDGLSICRRIHAGGGPPVIMLTAKDEDGDRIAGLNFGADDYVTKPFNSRVLLARIHAVLRRTRAPHANARHRPSECLRVEDLTVDLGKRSVSARNDGRELVLTSAEFDLLQCFVTRPQRVLSRDELLDWTRGRVGDPFDRTIDVQVSRLRRKLDENGSLVADRLKTVRTAGYILASVVEPV